VKLITNDAAKNEESKEVKRIKDQLKALKKGELTADEIEL
jgi:O-phosphoseryl-tRNA(Cys) synthetase